ncbi:hypothetical protein Ddye_004676 [Dipteronia dyeriana]|uniref:RSE1/DDB1/CPSF1 first beta-propeller domain-containing protein n=1 Tax=Dipteronia dyeriana TaxID=168575 RepID=A0AAD9XEY7_9ROSI|nr:hypothetical protein Ddye_004676 [Dipteronia dyeriana]
MSIWNYAVTAHKPTNVTHSCVCNFTAPQELNLIVAKCTRVEIHLLTPQGLQPMLDVPIYGRIAILELFRPHGEAQDFLLIATERYKFSVLQWDTGTNELITRARGDVSDRIGRPTDNGQIGVIDPNCRLIGLHLYDGLFKVIPFDNNGQLEEAYNIRIPLMREDLQVLDIKFLYGCSEPTIVVLYQDKKDGRDVKTYEVDLNVKDFVEGPLVKNNLGNGASLLIPVPPPLCGVLIIGQETISITKAFGRVDADGSRHLLGDHAGLLHPISLDSSTSIFRVTGLKIELLGETSIASTISYLGNEVVYIGSSCGDSQRIKLNPQPVAKGSYVEVLERYVNLAPIVDFCVVDLEKQGQGQASAELHGITGMWSLRSPTNDSFDTFLVLIKLNLQPDAKGPYVEVLERYVNLGPIVDFCVVDLEKQGQGQVVTCSGPYKDGSLRIVRNGIGINEQASMELQGITGMWSLRPSTDDPFDTFLVVSFFGET